MEGAEAAVRGAGCGVGEGGEAEGADWGVVEGVRRVAWLFRGGRMVVWEDDFGKLDILDRLVLG